jgi:hypothetical protein
MGVKGACHDIRRRRDVGDAGVMEAARRERLPRRRDQVASRPCPPSRAAPAGFAGRFARMK